MTIYKNIHIKCFLTHDHLIIEIHSEMKTIDKEIANSKLITFL